MPENAYDVIVIGGGPAGMGAAIGAAKTGAQVCLIERHDVLGGMGTSALVSNFCPAHYDRERFIIDGVFGDLRRRLIARKAIYTVQPSQAAHPRMEPYDPEIFAEEAAAFCQEVGVRLFLATAITGCDLADDGGCTVTLDPGGPVSATTLVDATGDAVFAAGAGVPCSFGSGGDGAVMPLTLCYLIGGIDVDIAAREFPEAVSHDPLLDERYIYYTGEHGRVHDWVMAARHSGELSIPATGISGIQSTPGDPQRAMVNFGRVSIKDPTDPQQLEDATRIGRRQVDEGIRFFRNYLPGFAEVELVELPRQIGVRESRQIVSQYILTGADVRACRQFDDCIAQCCYAIDVHQADDGGLLEPLSAGTHFDIPWRSLVPADGPDNLVVAGRCIGAEVEAMSSFRVSPSCMAIGHAAGVGAALAAQRHCAIRDVNYRDIQSQLLAQGAILQ